ncbi:MAG: diadenosine tetraphosphatase [Lysobacter sp.]|nr:diadenosine tetraphosphatase [Lysobacter sp.]
MTVWAIGDLQGCYDATQRLLERIKFDPAQDRLWFCGDLVNRGGQSLETLRLVHSLREYSTTVLGNHDLSLLAIGERTEEEKRKVNPDLQRIVLAEVEERLHSDQYKRLLKNMYGDRPAWNPKLAGIDRHRAIINIFTRLRYCTPRGRIAFEDKGSPGTQPVGLYPWYEVPGRAERDLKIVCGHWSTLGLFIGHGVHAIDTGAVWGGKLTALQLDTNELRLVQVPGRDVPAHPPRPRPPRQPN